MRTLQSMLRLRSYPLVTSKARISFSQEGEDLVLHRLFDYKLPTSGFYIDVGAHDPIRYSNTMLYYLMGWKGIVIDPLPGLVHSFTKVRRRDTALEMGVSLIEGTLEYCMFEDAAFNTFDRTRISELVESGRTKIIDRKQVQLKTLASICDAYLPPGQNIDFMSVDVEGKDADVLRSHDWERYRPRFVLAEADCIGLKEVAGNDVVEFLNQNDYEPVAKTRMTLFFEDKHSRQGRALVGS